MFRSLLMPAKISTKMSQGKRKTRRVTFLPALRLDGKVEAQPECCQVPTQKRRFIAAERLLDLCDAWDVE
jgi:hypothetical protein